MQFFVRFQGFTEEVKDEGRSERSILKDLAHS